jgi:hypothetical protein
LTLPRLRIAATLAKKALGFRYLMKVIPLDASLVRGSHGRVTDRLEDGPLFISSEKPDLGDVVEALTPVTKSLRTCSMIQLSRRS